MNPLFVILILSAGGWLLAEALVAVISASTDDREKK